MKTSLTKNQLSFTNCNTLDYAKAFKSKIELKRKTLAELTPKNDLNFVLLNKGVKKLISIYKSKFFTIYLQAIEVFYILYS